MKLKDELRNLSLKQKEYDIDKQRNKVERYWDSVKGQFADYLRSIARKGLSHCGIKYEPNLKELIDIYMPIEISLRANSDDAKLIEEFIMRDLGLMVITQLRKGKIHQYICW